MLLTLLQNDPPEERGATGGGPDVPSKRVDKKKRENELRLIILLLTE